jgi:hypothetical protein
MKRIVVVLLGLATIAISALSVIEPAFALGGCGLNRHRSSVTGLCIWGGQDQSWCLKHTGHTAVRGPHGT